MTKSELNNITYGFDDVERILKDRERALEWMLNNWDSAVEGLGEKGIKELEQDCIDTAIIIQCIRHHLELWTI